MKRFTLVIIYFLSITKLGYSKRCGEPITNKSPETCGELSGQLSSCCFVEAKSLRDSSSSTKFCKEVNINFIDNLKEELLSEELSFPEDFSAEIKCINGNEERSASVQTKDLCSYKTDDKPSSPDICKSVKIGSYGKCCYTTIKGINSEISPFCTSFSSDQLKNPDNIYKEASETYPNLEVYVDCGDGEVYVKKPKLENKSIFLSVSLFYLVLILSFIF